MKNIKDTELMEIFEKASRTFLKEEKELILSGVNERCWYHPFADYLKEEMAYRNIDEYYVDTEYNRNNGKLKTMFDAEQQIKVIKITCDVIVHSRGKNKEQDNLICIEMKKSTADENKKEADKRRMQILTKDSFDDIWSYDGKTLPEHVCRYKLGVYYEINLKVQMVYVEYYKKGSKMLKYEVEF